LTSIRAGFGSPPAKEIIDGFCVTFRISRINDLGVFPIRRAKCLQLVPGCFVVSGNCGLIIHKVIPELLEKKGIKDFSIVLF
jgi:hypothetical protein